MAEMFLNEYLSEHIIVSVYISFKIICSDYRVSDDKVWFGYF